MMTKFNPVSGLIPAQKRAAVPVFCFDLMRGFPNEIGSPWQLEPSHLGL